MSGQWHQFSFWLFWMQRHARSLVQFTQKTLLYRGCANLFLFLNWKDWSWVMLFVSGASNNLWLGLMRPCCMCLVSKIIQIYPEVMNTLWGLKYIVLVPQVSTLEKHSESVRYFKSLVSYGAVCLKGSANYRQNHVVLNLIAPQKCWWILAEQVYMANSSQNKK